MLCSVARKNAKDGCKEVCLTAFRQPQERANTMGIKGDGEGNGEIEI